ncbi:heavy metal translocating P-type ATPase [Kerstersia gyiorum]|uniref:heavy metal translocating P-type ATPase n=1 Tax=Kerstersia gyiorum TaxID=206506 RepID=UPI0039ECBB84
MHAMDKIQAQAARHGQHDHSHDHGQTHEGHAHGTVQHDHDHARADACCAPGGSVAGAACAADGGGDALACCDHGGHGHGGGFGWLLWVAGAAALGSEIAHWALGDGNWLVLLLAVVAIVCSGFSTYKAGLAALVRLDLNMNALMTVAVTGAVLIGQWPEAAMVMFLFTLAELIEERSLERARNAVRTLMDIAPETVDVQQADGSWLSREAAQVPVGSLVRARPGERIALDGEIVEGQAALDQSPITGESLPVEKGPGDSVFAGSINTSTLVIYRSTAPADGSKLARIIAVVEGAQASRAPTQRFVDRFARIYTPAVFVIALLVAILPPLLLGGAWMDWIYRALVLLVIACPCALVISTPVTIVSGLAAAARVGVLIKGGVFLEQGRKLSWVALDKTGTLTHGKPALTDIQVHDGMTMSAPADAAQSDGMLALAASLASLSDHPVSQAVARHAAERGLALQQVEGFEAVSGQGTQGIIGGRGYRLGNWKLMAAGGVVDTAAQGAMDALASEGKTVVALASGTQMLALFGVADTLRATSREAIGQLHELGVSTLMLSGDNQHVAQAIAREAGIDDARGDQLPEDKLSTVRGLQERGMVVGMVGDGINDAPALAQADIGFAMGAAGSDTAMETADVALMDDDLRKLPYFIRLARRTARVLWQNIGLALGIKVVFLALAIAGEASMWMAVFADMGASLLVVFNGLRLLRATH